MENNYVKERGDIIKPAIIILAALFFSICILNLSNSVVWTVVMFSVLLGIFSIWLPLIIPISFIVVTLIVPDEVLSALSQTNELYGFGIVKLHPAGIVLFIGALVNIVARRNILINKLRGSRLLFGTLILFAIFSVSIFAQTLPLGGFRGIPQCLENYFFPFCFFLYLLTLTRRDMLSMLKCFTCVVLLIAMYGLFEHWNRLNFIYDKLYSTPTAHLYRGAFSEVYRITTTIGHPLKNALYFIFSIPISIFLFKKPYNIISTAILILAIFATGSRAAFFISGLIIMACYIKMEFNIFEHYKSAMIAAIIALSFYLVLYHSALGDTLIRRFYTAGDSTLIRMHGMHNASEIIRSNFFLGKGMGLSFEYSQALLRVENVGFENPWLMLITDVGVVTTLCYALILLLPVIAKINNLKYKNVDRAVYLSLIAFLLMTYTFNSFGSRNSINFLLWFNIALLYNTAQPGEAS